MYVNLGMFFFTFNLNENVPEIFFDVFFFPTSFWGSFQPKKKNIKIKFFAWYKNNEKAIVIKVHTVQKRDIRENVWVFYYQLFELSIMT